MLALLIVLTARPVPAFGAARCARDTLVANLPASQLLHCLERVSVLEHLDAPAFARAEGQIYSRAITHPEPEDVEAMQAILRELDRRGETGASDLALQESVRLLHGLFEEANALAARNRTVGSAQWLHKEQNTTRVGSAHAWGLTSTGVLEEETIDLSHGIKIVVDAAPDCEFCIPAARWLAASPDLGPVFRADSVWISRPGVAELRVATYAGWNKTHPAFPMRVVTDVQGWPMPDSWSTPRFTVLRDGQRVGEVLGWTPRTPDSLRSTLAHVGVVLAARHADAPVPTPFDPHPAGDPEHDRTVAQLRAEQLTEDVRLAMAPIRSRSELDAYLHAHPIGATPFAPLSPASRARFIDALIFDDHGGLISSPFRDVDAELTYTQAYRLLALFGREDDLRSLSHLRIESARDRLLRDWTHAARQ